MIKINIIEKKEIQEINEDTSIENLLKYSTPYTWEKVFDNAKNELKDISDLLAEDKREYPIVYPLRKNVFKVFHLTPLNKIRVVIVGQDPYHGVLQDGTPQATGLAFSVPFQSPIPSSLKNIYKELLHTVTDFKMPTHGDLTKWAVTERIFLLNTSLTVRSSQADSHGDIWLGFIKKVVKAIVEANPDVIFILWGKKAERISKFIGNNVSILTAAHPSGLSCHRGFFGCNHFNKINELLKEKLINQITESQKKQKDQEKQQKQKVKIQKDKIINNISNNIVNNIINNISNNIHTEFLPIDWNV